jgi:hypothetical protein
MGTSGNTTITVGTGLNFSTGQSIAISYDVNNIQYADVVSYTSGSGSLTFQKVAIKGSGTYSTWVINLDGAVGALGYSGSKGDIGYTGSQGPAGGYTGSKGDIGYTGSQGVIGYTGSQGMIGYSGSLGYSGSQGMIGYSGSQGIQGYTGSAATGTITFSSNTISGASNTNIQISPNGTGKLDLNSHAIINVTDPSNAQDAATKNYVDSATSSVPSAGFTIAMGIAL